jgi:uncharacterized protein
MKRLADASFLLAFAAEGNAHHAKAIAWWTKQPDGATTFICRPMQAALLRLLSTEEAMGDDALTLRQAWAVYALMLDSGRFAFAAEPAGISVVWESFCRPFGRSPKVVADAYLAAFAVLGGYTVLTFDRAFAQFPKLRFELP